MGINVDSKGNSCCVVSMVMQTSLVRVQQSIARFPHIACAHYRQTLGARRASSRYYGKESPARTCPSGYEFSLVVNSPAVELNSALVAKSSDCEVAQLDRKPVFIRGPVHAWPSPNLTVVPSYTSPSHERYAPCPACNRPHRGGICPHLSVSTTHTAAVCPGLRLRISNTGKKDCEELFFSHSRV